MEQEKSGPEPAAIGYRVSTVAKMLDVSVWTVYHLIDIGSLTVTRYHAKGVRIVTAESLQLFKESLVPINAQQMNERRSRP